MIPRNAAKILVAGSMKGWFTGRSIPMYITSGKSNFKSARSVINGTDKAQAIAAIARDYDCELKQLGYSEEPQAPKDYVVPEISQDSPKITLASFLINFLLRLFKK